MNSMGKKHLHWAWIILAVCFADLFINYSIRLGYGVVLPEMIRDLRLSRTAGGTIFNAYLLVYIFLTPLTGFLTDRFGARRVITVCALILGLGALHMGRGDGLKAACFAFALTGVGATGMWTSVITVVQRWFAPQRRGLALGILSAGYGLGFACTGVAFPWIIAQFNWRFIWYFLGGGAWVMVAFNGWLLRSDPESAGERPWGTAPDGQLSEPAGPSPGGVYSTIFKDRIFWLIGSSFVCVSFSLYGITTFMIDYARYQVGLPLNQAGLLATIHGVCQVGGVLTILPLSDRLGRRTTIIGINLFVALALVGVAFLGASWPVLCLLIGVLGVCYGATFPSYGALAGDYFPKEIMGTVIGAWVPFYGLGAMAVHWVSGFMRDQSGRYDESFLISAAAAMAGLFLMTRVRRRVK